MPQIPLNQKRQPDTYQYACCPSCERYSVFSFTGTQHFPAEVAEKTGLPATIHLYTCTRCKTSVSHVSLMLAC